MYLPMPEDFFVAHGADFSFREGWANGRRIWIPTDEMRLLQSDTYDLLLFTEYTDYYMEAAHGSVKGRNLLTNASPHLGNRYFFQTDIRKAFPSVNISRLAAILEEFGFKSRLTAPAKPKPSKVGQLSLWAEPEPRSLEQVGIEKWLDRYCCVDDPDYGRILATGAASVPMLFNMYAAELMDQYLYDLLYTPFELKRTAYTRYVDDLTFSAQEPFGRKRRKRLIDVVRTAGFDINHHKTIATDLTKHPVTICGVLITEVSPTANLRATPARRRKAEGAIATAMSSHVFDPTEKSYTGQAHGHAGAVYAATEGHSATTDPTIQKVRRSQEKLKNHR